MWGKHVRFSKMQFKICSLSFGANHNGTNLNRGGRLVRISTLSNISDRWCSGSCTGSQCVQWFCWVVFVTAWASINTILVIQVAANWIPSIMEAVIAIGVVTTVVHFWIAHMYIAVQVDLASLWDMINYDDNGKVNLPSPTKRNDWNQNLADWPSQFKWIPAVL